MSTILLFEDLKSALDLSKAAITDYPQLEELADSVHAALESYTGRRLRAIEKVTETGFLVDSLSIDLINLPIVSISYVEVNSEEVTDYTLSALGLDLSAKVSYPWKVIVKGGYKDIPADVYRAELMQTIYEYQNINNLATKSTTNDGGSTQTNEGFALLKEVQRLLNPFKLPSKLGF